MNVYQQDKMFWCTNILVIMDNSSFSIIIFFFRLTHKKKSPERYKVWQNVKTLLKWVIDFSPASHAFFFFLPLHRFRSNLIFSNQIQQMGKLRRLFLGPKGDYKKIKSYCKWPVRRSSWNNWSLHTATIRILSLFLIIPLLSVSQQVREPVLTERHGGIKPRYLISFCPNPPPAIKALAYKSPNLI